MVTKSLKPNFSHTTRDLRWSEKHFPNKSTEYIQTESKEKDENQNYQCTRNVKKYLLNPNQNIKENILASNSGIYIIFRVKVIN